MVCKYFMSHLVKSLNLEQRMHKSKLAGFIIDCQTTDLDRAAEFWGGALGMAVRTWCVMEAPTGQRFCVIRASSEGFDSTASQWD
jgi:hypothetical protein